MAGQSTLERALDLARVSHCRTVEDIKRRLIEEGYSGVQQHLSGLSIRKQLRTLIQEREQRLAEAGAD